MIRPDVGMTAHTPLSQMVNHHAENRSGGADVMDVLRAQPQVQICFKLIPATGGVRLEAPLTPRAVHKWVYRQVGKRVLLLMRSPQQKEQRALVEAAVVVTGGPLYKTFSVLPLTTVNQRCRLNQLLVSRLDLCSQISPNPPPGHPQTGAISSRR